MYSQKICCVCENCGSYKFKTSIATQTDSDKESAIISKPGVNFRNLMDESKLEMIKPKQNKGDSGTYDLSDSNLSLTQSCYEFSNSPEKTRRTRLYPLANKNIHHHYTPNNSSNVTPKRAPSPTQRLQARHSLEKLSAPKSTLSKNPFFRHQKITNETLDSNTEESQLSETYDNLFFNFHSDRSHLKQLVKLEKNSLKQQFSPRYSSNRKSLGSRRVQIDESFSFSEIDYTSKFFEPDLSLKID